MSQSLNAPSLDEITAIGLDGCAVMFVGRHRSPLPPVSTCWIDIGGTVALCCAVDVVASLMLDDVIDDDDDDDEER